MARAIRIQYAVSALFKKRRTSGYSYPEWRELRTFGTKKEALDYAKRESKLKYRDSRTGRYMIEKQILEAFIENGKIVD